MTGEQDRNRAVERLLRETRGDTVSSVPCVDAESLAAWRDGTLPAPAARAVEAHVSECARCQSMLAVFARAEPGPLAPAEPFWHRWRFQWLVPAAAMAAALAVWVAVPRDRPSQSALATTSVESGAAPLAVPPGADAGLAGGAALAEAPMIPLTAGGQQGPGTLRQIPQGRPQNGAAAGADKRDVGPRERLSAGGQAASESRRREEAAGAARTEAPGQSSEPSSQIGSASAAKSAARPDKTEPTAAASGSMRQRVNAPPAPASAPAAATETGSSAGGAPLLPLQFDRASRARAPLDVMSPDAAHRWRVDSIGQLQYSSSAGATWQAVALAASDVLTAGMSPAGTICWLVGRSGAVWLTTDGVRFDRRPLAEPVDLISVRATDARHATLVAADGRTFATADGGVIWAPAAP